LFKIEDDNASDERIMDGLETQVDPRAHDMLKAVLAVIAIRSSYWFQVSAK